MWTVIPAWQTFILYPLVLMGVALVISIIGSFFPEKPHRTEWMRGMGEYHYRRGEWAIVQQWRTYGGNPVVDVIFPDGKTDTWVTNDPDNLMERKFTDD